MPTLATGAFLKDAGRKQTGEICTVGTDEEGAGALVWGLLLGDWKYVVSGDSIQEG